MNQQHDKLDLRAIAILTLLCMVWGINSVAIKFSNTGIDPVFGAGLRSFIAALGLLLWIRIKGLPLFPGKLADGMMVGLLFGVEFSLLYSAMLHTTAASAFLLLYSTPFFHALGAHFFLNNDHLTPHKTAGLLLAFGGIIILMSKHLTAPDMGRLTGDMLALSAAVVWAATTIYIKARLVGHVSAYHTLLYQIIFSIPILLLLSYLLGEAPIHHLDGLILFSVAYQSLVVAFASYLVWFSLVHTYPVSRLSAFTFLTPLFSALAGTVFLQEPITLRLVVALVLVSAGIYIVNK